MPIHNTFLVAPVAKGAPSASSSASPESTALGGIFGDILSDQSQRLPEPEAVVAAQQSPLASGKLLQSGGNILPEPPAPSRATTVLEVTAALEVADEPPALAINAAPQSAEITPPVAGPDLLQARPESESPALEPGDPPAAVVTPAINSVVYQVARQGTAAAVSQSGANTVEVVVDHTVGNQRVSPQSNVEGAAGMSSQLELDGTPVAATRPAMEQLAGRAVIEGQGQSRHAQLMAGNAEADGVLAELTVGRESSPIKTTVPVSPVIQGAIATPLVQSEGSMGVKMATGSALPMTPGEPVWNSEFAARVSTVVKNGVQEASLQLNPPELGRMDIKVTTDGDQAKIVFNVQNMAAKDAIEQAMPRLREMLEQGGLQLSQSEVSDQSAHQRRGREESGPEPGNLASETTAVSGELPRSEVAMVSPDTLVDYYI